MKILFSLFFFSLTPLVLFSQSPKKKATKQKTVAARDINTAGRDQFINYYTTIIFTKKETKEQIREKAIAATHGYFNKTRKDCSIEKPIIKLGNSGSKNSRGRLIQINNDPITLVDATSIDSQIHISVIIRDSKGDEVATIKGRSWHVKNANSIDYNNDGSGFEIVSGERVIFQIELKKDTVFYNGMLCSENGTCVFLSDKGGLSFTMRENGPQRFNLPPDFYVAPLFKYPRYEHLGERVSKKTK